MSAPLNWRAVRLGAGLALSLLSGATLANFAIGLVLVTQFASGPGGSTPTSVQDLEAHPLYWVSLFLGSVFPYITYALAGLTHVLALRGRWKPGITEALTGGGVSGLITGGLGALIMSLFSMLANWLTYVIDGQPPVPDVVFLGGGVAILVGVLLRSVLGAVIGGVAGGLTAAVLATRR